MSILAHAIYGAPGFEAEKRDLDSARLHETREIRRIQRERGITWGEALAVYFYGASVLDPIIPNQETP